MGRRHQTLYSVGKRCSAENNKLEEIESLEDNNNEPERLKEAGNEAFKKGNYEDAIECYTKPSRRHMMNLRSKRLFISKTEQPVISNWTTGRMLCLIATNLWSWFLRTPKLCLEGARPMKAWTRLILHTVMPRKFTTLIPRTKLWNLFWSDFTRQFRLSWEEWLRQQTKSRACLTLCLLSRETLRKG